MSEHELKSKAAFIKRIVVFCIENQGRCFHGWDAPKIWKFISWQFLAGNVFLTEKAGKIDGVAIAWLARPEEIIMRETTKQPVFSWNFIVKGNSLYISHLFGSRSSSVDLWKKCVRKWPFIKSVFVHRKDVLKEYPVSKVGRICHV